jgi:hypothetical protein
VRCAPLCRLSAGAGAPGRRPEAWHAAPFSISPVFLDRAALPPGGLPRCPLSCCPADRCPGRVIAGYRYDLQRWLLSSPAFANPITSCQSTHAWRSMRSFVTSCPGLRSNPDPVTRSHHSSNAHSPWSLLPGSGVPAGSTVLRRLLLPSCSDLGSQVMRHLRSGVCLLLLPGSTWHLASGVWPLASVFSGSKKLRGGLGRWGRCLLLVSAALSTNWPVVKSGAPPAKSSQPSLAFWCLMALGGVRG